MRLPLLSAACAASLTAFGSAPAQSAPAASDDTAAAVDPLIGTGGLVVLKPASKGRYEDLPPSMNATHPFGGLTYPGAQVPFGMIQLGPDANTEGHGWSAGYNAYDRSVIGFSHMHTSGNGRGFGHILLAPTAGPLVLEPGDVDHPDTGYRSRFRPERQRAEAGYYRVHLDDHDIEAELTATTRAGFHRYTFPRRADAHLILDLQHGLGKVTAPESASVTIVAPDLITGFRRAAGSAGPVYFAMRLSRPFAAAGIAVDGTFTKGRRAGQGKSIKAAFDFDTRTDPVLLVKVGLSFVSVEGARNNLDTEIGSWDFDSTRAAARAAWNRALGKVRIEGATPAEQRIFYSALYHTQLAPFVFADRDDRFLGADGKVHQGEFVNHTFFSLWDTYRNVHPLFTIIAPERVPHFIRSMIEQAELGDGLLPNYSVAGRNGTGMVGMPAMPVIADAYAKGLHKLGVGFDPERAYSLVKDNLMRDMLGLDHYKSKGYVAADREVMRSAAHTLEFAVADAAAADMARRLGHLEDERLFRTRAANYRNVIDTKVGFARGRLSDGSWRTPFDPRAVSHYQPGDDFIEATAWQYTFFVPHDVAGLVRLLGGRARFVAKLDELFDQPAVLTGSWSADVTGLWGQYAAGNEQSLHIAYLYDWAGAPWKGQARVRELGRRFYTDKPDGLAGNDDAGSLSSFYVWSALGMYPVNPIGGVYAIGSPYFSRAVVDVGDGREFVVTAKNNSPENVYIQSATLNGSPLRKPWVRHEDVMRGGALTFVMGAKPNRAWGAAPSDAPPSLSDSAFAPRKQP